MKKQLFLILLTISVIAKAQTKSDAIETESQKSMTDLSKKKRHSLSLDVIAGLVFPAFNPRYEYDDAITQVVKRGVPVHH